MKAIRRSRRYRLSHRKNLLIQSKEEHDNDDSDLEHQTLPLKSIVRSNKNANRIPTVSFDTSTNISNKDKQRQLLDLSSDPSSLFLYSSNSMAKSMAVSDDLTSLSKTTTNTTPLTPLTCSNIKQTETVKIDLTQLSSTDTLASSSVDTQHIQSLSFDRKFSSLNMNNKIKNSEDFTHMYDTDTSMKSVVFSKDNGLERDLSSYHKHLSCFTISGRGNGNSMTMKSTSIVGATTVNTTKYIGQQRSMQWILSRWQNITPKLQILISCSSVCLIIGILVLLIIL